MPFLTVIHIRCSMARLLSTTKWRGASAAPKPNGYERTLCSVLGSWLPSPFPEETWSSCGVHARLVNTQRSFCVHRPHQSADPSFSIAHNERCAFLLQHSPALSNAERALCKVQNARSLKRTTLVLRSFCARSAFICYASGMNTECAEMHESDSLLIPGRQRLGSATMPMLPTR